MQLSTVIAGLALSSVAPADQVLTLNVPVNLPPNAKVNLGVRNPQIVCDITAINQGVKTIVYSNLTDMENTTNSLNTTVKVPMRISDAMVPKLNEDTVYNCSLTGNRARQSHDDPAPPSDYFITGKLFN